VDAKVEATKGDPMEVWSFIVAAKLLAPSKVLPRGGVVGRTPKSAKRLSVMTLDDNSLEMAASEVSPANVDDVTSIFGETPDLDNSRGTRSGTRLLKRQRQVTYQTVTIIHPSNALSPI